MVGSSPQLSLLSSDVAALELRSAHVASLCRDELGFHGAIVLRALDPYLREAFGAFLLQRMVEKYEQIDVRRVAVKILLYYQQPDHGIKSLPATIRGWLYAAARRGMDREQNLPYREVNG